MPCLFLFPTQAHRRHERRCRIRPCNGVQERCNSASAWHLRRLKLQAYDDHAPPRHTIGALPFDEACEMASPGQTSAAPLCANARCIHKPSCASYQARQMRLLYKCHRFGPWRNGVRHEHVSICSRRSDAAGATLGAPVGLRRTRAVSVRSCALSVATRPPEVLAVEGAVGRPRRGVHAALRRIATPGPDPAEERLPDGVRVRVEVVDLGGGGAPKRVNSGGLSRGGRGHRPGRGGPGVRRHRWMPKAAHSTRRGLSPCECGRNLS